tara:strand:+ start:272 stop:490 length:219 start_codon:yes stop_codon:yes gene_type:complete
MKKYNSDGHIGSGCIVLKQGVLSKSLGKNVVFYGEDCEYNFLDLTSNLLRLVSHEKDLWFSFDQVEFLEVFE